MPQHRAHTDRNDLVHPVAIGSIIVHLALRFTLPLLDNLLIANRIRA